MTKFNSKKVDSTVTVNKEGAKAYKNSDKVELINLVSTSLVQNMFYEREDDRIDRLKKLVEKIAKTDPEFIAKLISYTRNKMNLRSVTHILLVELALNHNGDDLVKKATMKGVQRLDDITEILSYWKHRLGIESLGKKAISKQLKVGLAQRFSEFDEYHYAKYKQEGKGISLRDALFLIHAKPKSGQEKVFKKLIDRELKNTETWESGVKFETLIMEEKLPYMAALRNLNNIVKENVSTEALVKVTDYLKNKTAVLNGKQLPFRYYSAYNALIENGVPKNHIMIKAIEGAMKVSAENITGFDKNEKILICADVSGSMNDNISGKSDIRCVDIGMVFASTLNSFSNFADVYVFGTNCIPMDNLITGNIMHNVELMENQRYNAGGGTYGAKCLEKAIKSGKIYDKIVFFTDLQIYGQDSMEDMWKRYKVVNPNCKLILFNLAGYGTTPVKVNNKNVIEVAGWSDKIFDVLDFAMKEGSILEAVENESLI